MSDKKTLKGFRLRALFGFTKLLAKFGIVGNVGQVTSQPIEKRKANKAAGWTTFPLPADVTMTYDTITARSGPMVIKKYLPPKLNPDCPRALFLHGGGWITGGVDTLDHLCANLSRTAQCLVVSADYRLAPETPFPGALEDCCDALNWIATDTTLSPALANGVVVVGESAGANLAAALCVLNERRGGPAIRHQTLIYPAVDATLNYASMDELGTPGFDRMAISALIELYRGTTPATDPLISPLFAENHAKLPPALIITADLDPARDDGERYARTLADAGVFTKYVNYEGMPHGFFFTPRICSAAAEGVAEISATIVALSKNKRP
ncbi:alpha/beta hydrolase [Stenotrophobium rhamnosiphilum]|uniref:Alpha/beta hydrolase n=1 Tax=Stenotrophobium rhamnosiphilum TaxID=2029166 RepID=A0A2T5MGY6_9GAMM|nr:alpha/beta hydrolase [Stenotrophobium rhamnosiphilum]PTU31842.1 alpha/beta hydrolase [Stenotrophobium rhamnosiphilum]